MQASITGHLVVSTLHTNDTASSVTRLLDMGVESYLIADALTGIIAQRLVRRLCPNCKRRHVLLEHELEYLGLTPEEKDSAEVYEPVGCQRCAGTGYFDRIGIYEIMEITPRMRTMISHRCDTGTLRETAIAEGMHTLRESARRLVCWRERPPSARCSASALKMWRKKLILWRTAHDRPGNTHS